MAFDGTYKVVVQTPMGPQESKVVLKIDGNSVSGSSESMMGKAEFSGGTVNGNNLEWSAQIPSPKGLLAITFKVTINGDKMSGQAISPFGPAPLEGTKI